MTNVTLHKVARPRPPNKSRRVWMLRWYGTDGKRYGETIGDAKQVSKRDAEATRREKQSKLDCGVVKPDRPGRMALEEFSEMYMQRRSRGDSAPSRPWHKRYAKLAPSTLLEHDMGLRYLMEHFGHDRPIDSVSPNDADAFLDALSAGKLASARHPSKRRVNLGEQRVRALIRICKGIFGWSQTFGYVSANPFTGFDGNSHATPSKHDVSLADFEKLLAVAPPGWRELFALCRLAGLRRGEALSLPWSGRAVDRNGTERFVGVDWDRRRLCLVAAKTSGYREIPLCPRLHDVLMDAFEHAPAGQVVVVRLSGNNLNRDAEKLIRLAGLVPWKRTFQAMRVSCENEWKLAGLSEPTYAAWIGHSPAVSRRHYVSPTEAEFAAVSGHT